MRRRFGRERAYPRKTLSRFHRLGAPPEKSFISTIQCLPLPRVLREPWACCLDPNRVVHDVSVSYGRVTHCVPRRHVYFDHRRPCYSGTTSFRHKTRILLFFDPSKIPKNSRFSRRAARTVAFGLSSRGSGDLFSIYGAAG